MYTVETVYLGELRTKAIHARSGTELITDAPIDNKGKGEKFSPTDLVATALGSCMMTIIAQSSDAHNFDVVGTQLKITKMMSSNPRKISEIIVEFDFPKNNYTDKQKQFIEHGAKTCPVALSLDPNLKQTLVFYY